MTNYIKDKTDWLYKKIREINPDIIIPGAENEKIPHDEK